MHGTRPSLSQDYTLSFLTLISHLFLFDDGSSVTSPSSNKMTQRVACHHYHGNNSLPDRLWDTSSSAALLRAKLITLEGNWAISATWIPKLRSHTPEGNWLSIIHNTGGLIAPCISALSLAHCKHFWILPCSWHACFQKVIFRLPIKKNYFVYNDT